MRLGLALLSVGVLSTAATADVLWDNLYITDNMAYSTGNGACIGGINALGSNSDLQMADDFVVPGAVPYMLTDMTADFVGFLNGYNYDVLIEVFEVDGSHPAEVPMYSAIFGVDITDFTDGIFGLYGKRKHADMSAAGWTLNPGTYFISMQPLTYFGDGDWYYQIAAGDGNPTGYDRQLRDPGLDPDFNHGGELGFGPFQGGYGYADFVDANLIYGNASDMVFKVEGVAVPAPGALALLGLAGLVGRRRR